MDVVSHEGVTWPSRRRQAGRQAVRAKDSGKKILEVRTIVGMRLGDSVGLELIER